MICDRFVIEQCRFADTGRDCDKNLSGRLYGDRCADPRLLPCPLTLRSSPGEPTWNASTCFQRVDYVGEELDGVCANADGSLELYVDNAPQYLTQ